MDLQALLDLLAQMVSLDSKVSRERWDRKETQVLPAPKDHLVPQALRVLLVFLDPKVLAVLRDLLVPLVSPERLAELDHPVQMVTPDPPVPLDLQGKTGPRV